MLQVIINVILLSIATASFLYFGLAAFLELDSRMQNKRSIKHAAKYDALLARS